jgi:hypothetical protein
MGGAKWGDTPDSSGVSFLLDAGLIFVSVLLSLPTLRDLVTILRTRSDLNGTSGDAPGPQREFDKALVPVGAEALQSFGIPTTAGEIRPTACGIENVTG